MKNMKNFLPLMLAAALALPLMTACDKEADSVSNVSSNGKSGSTARFTLQGNNLLALSGDYLISYDMADPRTGLTRVDSIQTTAFGWGMAPETVFPFRDHLLLGTPNGMQIYKNSGGDLQYVSTYTHVVSCDPVVAQGDYAYVTLRQETGGWNRCNRGFSQLEVINISDLRMPSRVNVTPMNKPYGLAVNGDDLFVCEDAKVCHLDVSNPTQPRIIRWYEATGNDCIYDRGRLIVVGASGLVQYQIDGDHLTELSRIAATRTGG